MYFEGVYSFSVVYDGLFNIYISYYKAVLGFLAWWIWVSRTSETFAGREM